MLAADEWMRPEARESEALPLESSPDRAAAPARLARRSGTGQG
jgi:hypothetical protein